MGKKKILIMVMSCQNDFFVEQENYVKDTWAKDIINRKYDNISFVIYRGGYAKNSYSRQDNLLKLNVEDDLKNTFKKTYFALSMVNNVFNEYDYVFRTNTSTFVNVELLDAFVQHIENDDLLFSGEIYSLSELNTPYPMCLSVRGNSLLLSKKNINIILKEGLAFLYNMGYDDTTISSIMNSYHIKNGEDYKEYLRSFYHGWYKCIPNDYDNGHALCTYGNNIKEYDYWKHFITIQIRNYGDLRSFECRENESDKFYELQHIFEGRRNDNIDVSLKMNIDRSTNFDIFIGSILGYISYDKWKSIEKSVLYYKEMSNKANDDVEGQAQKDKPFIYVDYYYNKTNEILI